MRHHLAYRTWGTLDLLHFFWVTGASVAALELPLITPLLTSYDIAASYGNNIPIYAAWATLLLYVSLLLSGVFLLSGKKIGLFISFAQFPLRLIFVVPSIFFIPWIGKAFPIPPPAGMSISIYIFIVVTEVYKLITLRPTPNNDKADHSR